METAKISALKWFLMNYIGWLIVLMCLPITGVYLYATSEILSDKIISISTFTLSLAFCIITFRSKIRSHYEQTVIKSKSVERWKSKFLHLLFLPKVK